MHKSKFARSDKRGGKQQPLEVEVEFIGGEEVRKRWNEIYKLLEAWEPERGEDLRNDSNGPEYDQLVLGFPACRFNRRAFSVATLLGLKKNPIRNQRLR